MTARETVQSIYVAFFLSEQRIADIEWSMRRKQNPAPAARASAALRPRNGKQSSGFPACNFRSSPWRPWPRFLPAVENPETGGRQRRLLPGSPAPAGGRLHPHVQLFPYSRSPRQGRRGWHRPPMNLATLWSCSRFGPPCSCCSSLWKRRPWKGRSELPGLLLSSRRGLCFPNSSGRKTIGESTGLHVGELAGITASSFSNPEYQALRRWPAFFNAYWSCLQPVLASPLYADWQQSTRSLACRLAQELPVAVDMLRPATPPCWSEASRLSCHCRDRGSSSAEPEWTAAEHGGRKNWLGEGKQSIGAAHCASGTRQPSSTPDA